MNKFATTIGIIAGCIAIYQFKDVVISWFDEPRPKLIATAGEMNENNQYKVVVQNTGEIAAEIQQISCSRVRKFEDITAKVTINFVPDEDFPIPPSKDDTRIFTLDSDLQDIKEIEASDLTHAGELLDQCDLNFQYRNADGEFNFGKVVFLSPSLECDVGILADDLMAQHSTYLKEQLSGEEAC